MTPEPALSPLATPYITHPYCPDGGDVDPRNLNVHGAAIRASQAGRRTEKTATLVSGIPQWTQAFLQLYAYDMTTDGHSSNSSNIDVLAL